MSKKNDKSDKAGLRIKKQLKLKNAVTTGDRKKTIGEHLSFGASEAYKLLRTNLIFSIPDEDNCKIIGVVSSLRGEGKSTTSINLAYTLAQNGKRVLLIEADMRIPVMSATLQLKGEFGLSNVLAGMSTLSETVHNSVLVEGLSVLPAGEIPPNPSELLSSKRMGQVLETLSDTFEYIIVDLPPIEAVSDGLIISNLLSGMIVVVRSGYCDQVSLADAMRKMEIVNVKVLGFVFNGVESDKKQYRKYGKYGRYGKYSKYSKYEYSSNEKGRETR